MNNIYLFTSNIKKRYYTCITRRKVVSESNVTWSFTPYWQCTQSFAAIFLEAEPLLQVLLRSTLLSSSDNQLTQFNVRSHSVLEMTTKKKRSAHTDNDSWVVIAPGTLHFQVYYVACYTCSCRNIVPLYSLHCTTYVTEAL